ncbi:UPF0658 Golgi apparatus membrane protein C23H3.04 [Erysiphe neolycopersici]|uniref:UPF0658 Golgi apparatus membrane protein C23H3.04 n=1 Tax=Erysiphe neolycopersici TaxID=212602 RepID=A0A420I567_9PEZI|nr:UPF0658 Golgi apparatus membrane protein C23H3.04 [Erysiphe neolycopersici]
MAFGYGSRSSLVRIKDDFDSDQPYGGYHSRQGLPPQVKSASLRGRKMYRPTTPWAWAFMVTTVIQALNVLAIELYLFVKFQASLKQDKKPTPLSKSIPTYLTLFIFGFLYQLLLVYDSLRLKNTIQVIGLCIYNLGMLIYASIQYDQIKRAISGLSEQDYIHPSNTIWSDVRPFLLAVPCIIGTFTLMMSLIAWKLYDEFAWTIYKHISADLRMKRRFLTFQIYIALLKFDFFFFLGFTVQFVVIVTGLADTEYALTIAAIPVTVLILTMAGFWTRRENKVGMGLTIFTYFCGLGYFTFKLARMYQAKHEENYKHIRKSLTSFAVLTIILIILTIINASACTANFGMGLKPHIMKRTIGGEEAAEKDIMTELPDLKHGPVSSRMTID